ncbi:hypothetical protein [Actinacidiphila soli]|uniref:hypothetical protein n=1 Tax=Actinacidiphila soli TaxID=2487275 RepID=UPI001F0C2631|nr:hypothetical protein [Actinacidiphila soli]
MGPYSLRPAELERWAAWVAPCPVPPAELRGRGARRRRINERSADRTRQRQPLLPTFVEHVETRHDHARQLLERAEQAVDGESFTLDGTTYTRVLTESDRRLSRHAAPVPPRLRNNDSGEMVHIASEEESAFWDWAAVETLRTPVSASRSCASSPTRASGNTSGPAARSSPCSSSRRRRPTASA